jgi:transposase, IS5 family
MKKQAGFFDFENCIDHVGEKQPFLRMLNQVFDWEIFRKQLDKLHIHETGGPGRPPFDSILMFKIILLQKLYGLSDDSMEAELYDRLSVMEFLGLDLSSRRPDAKTLWHFREMMRKRGLERDLFDRFESFLRKRGYETKKGVICDASLVEVPVQEMSQRESIEIISGRTPSDWQPKKSDDKNTLKRKANRLAQKDTDARWTVKNGVRSYGYKNHVRVDEKYKFVRSYEVSTASMHDSQMTDELLSGVKRGQKLFADSAYKSKETDKKLKRKGIGNFICLKGYKNKALSAQEKIWNSRKVSRVRSRVEHIFGDIRHFAGDFIRSIGILRARFQIGITNLLYNMRRLVSLERAHA